MSEIEHWGYDAYGQCLVRVESAYEQGRRSGIADERERAAKAGVIRGGEYVNYKGVVGALEQIKRLPCAYPDDPDEDRKMAVHAVEAQMIAADALSYLGGQ